MKSISKYKRIYNLALSIYSHVRHEDYVGAKIMATELLELLEQRIKEENAIKAGS